MQQAASITDRRADRERRQFTWRTVLYGFLRSRRHAGRVHTEGEPVYSDWHRPWLFFLVVSTMLLSCLDAFMTLELLDRGAYEANPVMAAIMGHSTQAFAASKMLLTGTGLLALVFLARARFLDRFRTGILLTVVFALYACLVCYEFVSLVRVI